jgi:hypothetical protein
MAKQLEFIFWGIACFWKTGDQYRVLLPDGRPDHIPQGVRPHVADVWFRPKDVAVRPSRHWKPFYANSFCIEQPSTMVVDGIELGTVDDQGLIDYLPSLKVADSQYTISDNPHFILETHIAGGTLKAHQLPDSGDNGSIYVQWCVNFADRVTLSFGSIRVPVPAGITQVVIANTAGSSTQANGHDFRLYRMLTDHPELDLDVPKPKNSPPHDGQEPDDPPRSGFLKFCPFIDCSGAGYP